jgi:hypothetical protein
MNSDFYKRIEQGTAHRKSRDENMNYVLIHPEYLPELVTLASTITYKNHFKALWVMELLSLKNTELLAPLLDEFCRALPHYTIEKAIRPSAKICYQLVTNNNIQLTPSQAEAIIETCLDRLINQVKVAPAAFSMRTLFVLGKKQPWIHEELKLLLSKDLDHPTPGYRFAVKDLLKRLK